MSDPLGISSVSITDLVSETNVFDDVKTSVVYTIIDHTVAPDVSTTIATIPGPQGPPGDKNVYVSTTPPENPKIGWIWIDIS